MRTIKILKMKNLKFLAITLALLGSLALNVATVAVSSVALMLSSVFDAVTGSAAVVSELRRDSASKDRRIRDMDGNLVAKDKEAVRLKGEIDQRDRRIASLDGDFRRSETRRVALADDLANSKRQVAGLSDKLTVRDREVAKLSAAVAEPKVTYRNRQQPLGEAVGDTVDRITKRAAVGSGRNVTAVFAEGIPLVGIGVAVAVTGYELKDSCDNLKDLRALELSINPSAAYSEDAKIVCGLKAPTREEVWEVVSNSPGQAWENLSSAMPDLGELHLPDLSFSAGWEKTKEGSANLWGSTKDTASATMTLIGEGADSAWQKMFGD